MQHVDIAKQLVVVPEGIAKDNVVEVVITQLVVTAILLHLAPLVVHLIVVMHTKAALYVLKVPAAQLF